MQYVVTNSFDDQRAFITDSSAKLDIVKELTQAQIFDDRLAALKVAEKANQSTTPTGWYVIPSIWVETLI